MSLEKYDVCIVGSGAGAGPVAYELSKAGYKVVVLEKGKYYKTKDFSKDEIVSSRRSVYTPMLKDEYHTIEEKNGSGYSSQTTKESGWDFWNGSLVGGSSNLMAGYFHKLKENDFKLRSHYGEIKDTNIEDWPISLKDLDPYYEKVAKIVGVSGEKLPFKPLEEHPVVNIFDKVCKELGFKSLKTARAIVSEVYKNRNSCSYSNFCGSYGCSTDAKSSSRVALLDDAVKTGNCDILAQSFVYELVNKNKKVIKAKYFNRFNVKKEIDAKIFVVACQSIETSRLLLNSKSKEFPNGLSNNNGQVGKNIVFSAGGSGYGELEINSKHDGLFVNRSLLDWYEINDDELGKIKGGVIDFMFEHANPIARVNALKWNNDGSLLYGKKLQDKIYKHMRSIKKFKYEIFCDWLPNDDCFVSIDEENKDKYGINVAKIRIGASKHDLKVGKFIDKKAKEVLKQMGAKNIIGGISSSPPQNLQAGGCRFGDDPKTSVLNKDCQSHEVANLYVSDGSFMPTGGSVPYTWTIYANAFRVASNIKEYMTR